MGQPHLAPIAIGETQGNCTPAPAARVGHYAVHRVLTNKPLRRFETFARVTPPSKGEEGLCQFPIDTQAPLPYTCTVGILCQSGACSDVPQYRESL